MTRLRVDVKFGLITDNPLTAGAVTINSAAFINLPAVTGTDDLLFTLDPAAIYGDPEIVRVTAHTASATSLTVVRAQLSTTARAHQQGVAWVHAPYTVDVIMQCTSATRPSVGLYSGLFAWETDTDNLIRWNGSAWTEAVPAALSNLNWYFSS